MPLESREALERRAPLRAFVSSWFFWSVLLRRRRLSRGERGFDRLGHLRRVGPGLVEEAGHHVAVTVDEELGEVPLDVSGEVAAGLLLGEELVERRLVVALHADLAGHRELHVVLARTELLDLGFG